LSQPILAETLLSIIHDLERRLRALETAPQLTSASIKDGALTIYDGSGRAIVVLGKQADGAYGMRVNDAGGAEVIRLGDLGSSQYGLRVRNAGGTEVARLGRQATGRYGLSSFDPSGNRVIDLGELAASRQGLEVFDAGGTAQVRVGQLAAGGYGLEAISGGQTVTLDTLAFRAQAAAIATSEAPGSTGTFQDLATVGPTVTVTVGTSGRMIVFPAAAANVASGGATCFAGFAVSGASTLAAAEERASMIGAAANSIFVKHAATSGILVTGLNPGVHTVTMKYKCISNVSSFYYRTLVVIPF
jgi:hypothetical protein